MEFAPHYPPAFFGVGGGDDAFVGYGSDETGLSLLKSPGDLVLPLYGDVLALKQGPYSYGNMGKENETLPLFEPLLLKQRHGRHSTLARTVSLSRLRNHQSRKMIPSRPSSSSSPAANASVSFGSSCKSPSLRSPLTVKNSSNISLGKGKGKSTPLRSLPTPPPPTRKSSSGSLRSSSLARSSPLGTRRVRTAARASPDRPRLSKTLPRDVEEELRVLCFDMGDGAFNGAATLIVGNPDTNCHAVFWAKPDRTEFVFHHGRLKEKSSDPNKSFSSSCSDTSSMSSGYDNTDKCCGCMVRGEPETSTFDIPPRLDEYRLELILGIGKSGIKMEPKLAAMVVMKLFLGMEVPEVLRM
ncbi:hypothetical protein PG996_006406 [Apiospora saccharicola]|uniref:Uncharacterized protein n=1 Tax=Apiospora saccharicola TaxID=335842 RepID=A0ABR1VPA9_9PEZI